MYAGSRRIVNLSLEGFPGRRKPVQLGGIKNQTASRTRRHPRATSSARNENLTGKVIGGEKGTLPADTSEFISAGKNSRDERERGDRRHRSFGGAIVPRRVGMKSPFLSLMARVNASEGNPARKSRPKVSGRGAGGR